MKSIALFAIRIYQKTLSPDHGPIQPPVYRCRYYPSCSQYAHEAIEQYGVLRGSAKMMYRILRCNPLSQGGVDHP